MKKFFAYAGMAASIVLVAFGIGAIVIGVAGRSDVRAEIAAQQITAGDDAAELTNGRLQPGQAVKTGADARAFADIMEFHTLKSTDGKRYAEMGRFVTPSGTDTSDEALAAKTPDGRLSRTGSATCGSQDGPHAALNIASSQQRVALFSIVMGIALSPTGIGSSSSLWVGARLVALPKRSKKLETASAAIEHHAGLTRGAPPAPPFGLRGSRRRTQPLYRRFSGSTKHRVDPRSLRPAIEDASGFRPRISSSTPTAPVALTFGRSRSRRPRAAPISAEPSATISCSAASDEGDQPSSWPDVSITPSALRNGAGRAGQGELDDPLQQHVERQLRTGGDRRVDDAQRYDWSVQRRHARRSSSTTPVYSLPGKRLRSFIAIPPYRENLSALWTDLPVRDKVFVAAAKVQRRRTELEQIERSHSEDWGGFSFEPRPPRCSPARPTFDLHFAIEPACATVVPRAPVADPALALLSPSPSPAESLSMEPPSHSIPCAVLGRACGSATADLPQWRLMLLAASPAFIAITGVRWVARGGDSVLICRVTISASAPGSSGRACSTSSRLGRGARQWSRPCARSGRAASGAPAVHRRRAWSAAASRPRGHSVPKLPRSLPLPGLLVAQAISQVGNC